MLVQDIIPNRREALGAAAGVLLLLRSSPAEAFLGIGEPSSEEVYKADTVRLQSMLEAHSGFHAQAVHWRSVQTAHPLPDMSRAGSQTAPKQLQISSEDALAHWFCLEANFHMHMVLSKGYACLCLQSKIVEEVKRAIALDKSDPGKEEAMENVRQGTNAWVAKYRRAGVTGRPSYG